MTPIYTAEDATNCLVQFRPVEYREWTDVSSSIRVRFWNAGHLLGSASVEMELGSKGQGDFTRIFVILAFLVAKGISESVGGEVSASAPGAMNTKNEE